MKKPYQHPSTVTRFCSICDTPMETAWKSRKYIMLVCSACHEKYYKRETSSMSSVRPEMQEEYDQKRTATATAWGERNYLATVSKENHSV